jgi:hypothetical protein
MRHKPLDGHPGMFTPVVITEYGEMSRTQIDRELQALYSKLRAETLTFAEQIKMYRLQAAQRQTICRFSSALPFVCTIPRVSRS